MPQIEHGGPKFQYRIFYKRDIPGEQYTVVDIPDWTKTKYVVNDQPTFQQYRIKVVAMNELGEANVAPKEVIGYSGEDGKQMICKYIIYPKVNCSIFFYSTVRSTIKFHPSSCPCTHQSPS